MAVALDTPSVTLIGSNGSGAWTFPDPERHVAIDMRVPCRTCNKHVCPNGTLACLAAITPEMVADRVLGLLANAPAKRG
jgi:ADP-heptose:LPS heptosyltransferase